MSTTAPRHRGRSAGRSIRRVPREATCRSWPRSACFVAMFGVGVGRTTRTSSTGQVILNLFVDNVLPARRRGRHDVRDPHRRHRPVGRLGGRAVHAARRAELVDGTAGRRCWSFAAGARRRPLLGLAMGCVIHYFEIQPFIVTLAGMFLARGLCYVDQHRLDPDHRPVSTRAGADADSAPRRALHLPPSVRDRAGRRRRRHRTCCTTPGSAATSTPSAATSSRRC